MFDLIAIKAAKNHATWEYPKESVGFIANDTYHECRNIHPNPEEEFKIHPEDLILAENLNAEVIIHSHPKGAKYPTNKDQEFQIASDIPHGIIYIEKVEDDFIIDEPFFWGDKLPIIPLIGREFRHAVYDCYSLIRDYYRLEKNIILPDFIRKNDWWNKGYDLYSENFEKAGFERIGERQVVEGDVMLGQIRSSVVNHGGIYVGRSEILHHLHNRLSRRESFLPWKRYITHYLRYVG